MFVNLKYICLGSAINSSINVHKCFKILTRPLGCGCQRRREPSPWKTLVSPHQLRCYSWNLPLWWRIAKLVVIDGKIRRNFIFKEREISPTGLPGGTPFSVVLQATWVISIWDHLFATGYNLISATWVYFDFKSFICKMVFICATRVLFYTYLIFVTDLTDISVEKKFVMWRNFRFLCMTDVEKSKFSPHVE